MKIMTLTLVHENENPDTDDGSDRSDTSEVDVQGAAAIWILKSRGAIVSQYQ